MHQLQLEYYKAIIESSNDAIIAKDMDGTITEWNPAAESLYGYSSEEAVGQHITIIFPKSHQGEFEEIMEKISNEQKIINYETTRVTKNNKKVIISLSISPIKNKDGTIIGASAIARNITEQKKNEHAKNFLINSGEILAASLDYKKTLKNVANSAVPHIADWCAIDILDENNEIKRLTVAHINPKKAKWAHDLHKRFPPSPDENYGSRHVIKTNETEFYPEITNELLEEVIENKERLELIKQVGITSAIVAPLTVHGKTFGAISFILTKKGVQYTKADCKLAEELARKAATAIENARLFEQLQKTNKKLEQIVAKRTEELSQAIEELRRSNQELEDFAKVASHDLQEPLRKINTFGNILQNKYSTDMDEKQQKYIERILHSTQRMRDLIEGLLEYSKVASTGQTFHTINLKSLVTEVLKDLEISIANTNGNINIENLPTIEADPLQMRQVFQNLISNALKFHKPDEPPQVHIYSKKSKNPKDHVKIVVKDEGIGFDEQYNNKIFTVFERLHSKNKFKGTGIGLAVVEKIITQHGGSIIAKSKPAQGTSFIITLPISQNGNMHNSLNA